MPSPGAASSQMMSGLQRPGWLTYAAVVMLARAIPEHRPMVPLVPLT
jgi:hypothetical protein